MHCIIYDFVKQKIRNINYNIWKLKIFSITEFAIPLSCQFQHRTWLKTLREFMEWNLVFAWISFSSWQEVENGQDVVNR